MSQRAGVQDHFLAASTQVKVPTLDFRSWTEFIWDLIQKQFLKFQGKMRYCFKFKSNNILLDSQWGFAVLPVAGRFPSFSK